MISIFQRPLPVAGFAITAAVLWGFAYPLIKLGLGEPFYMKYALAGTFAALGVYVINKT